MIYHPPKAPSLHDQWLTQTAQALSPGARTLPKFKIYHGMPPDTLKGPLLGWDEKFRPYVLQRRFNDDGVQYWIAISVNVIDRPSAHRLEEENKDLIQYWAHDPMGPDPGIPASQMASQEMLSTYGDPNKAKPIPPGLFHAAIQKEVDDTYGGLLDRFKKYMLNPKQGGK